MIVTIHQPEHMPWLGFFNKAGFADVFVFLDSVQYRKNYFQNRNRIRSTKAGGGGDWLTVPLQKQTHSTLISDRKILLNSDFKKKYLAKIENAYQGTEFFTTYFPEISQLILQEEESLSEMNIGLIEYFFQLLDIRCKCLRSSSLALGEVDSGGVVNFLISQAVGASTYISGPSGLDYLDETPFQENGIEVMYQAFAHPEYQQMDDTFTSHLCVLDLLFYKGAEATREIVASHGRIESRKVEGSA